MSVIFTKSNYNVNCPRVQVIFFNRSGSAILPCKCIDGEYQITSTKANKKKAFIEPVFFCLTLMVPDEGLSASCSANTQTGAASSFCAHLMCVCCNCWCLLKPASSICLTQKLPRNITGLNYHFQPKETAASATKDRFFFLLFFFLFCLYKLRYEISCCPPNFSVSQMSNSLWVDS